MAERRLQQIKDYLKANVSLETMLVALGGEVRERTGDEGRCQCINPDHDDSPRRGGSVALNFTRNHWMCFACAATGFPRGGDIFDLYALKHRLLPSAGNTFMLTLKGVAELNASALATQFGSDWRSAFGKGKRGGVAERFPITLKALPPIAPSELPPLVLGSEQTVPGYWLTPGSEPMQMLSSTAGPHMPRIRAHTERVRLLVFEALGVLAFCRADYSLLGVAGDEPVSFNKRVGVADVTTGRYLNHRSAPAVAESLVALSFVVENPLDLHMLMLASQPAVLGRFSPQANPLNALPADGRMLALLALLPTVPDNPLARFESMLKYGQAWIPKYHPLKGISSLITLGVARVSELALTARREAVSPAPHVEPLL